ncbi:MAG TPA: hypothetical protein VHE99_02235 [Gammaproteobacteria bacterium]|nr:hypothetical protein [Gammaproteobacteria bacterium]
MSDFKEEAKKGTATVADDTEILAILIATAKASKNHPNDLYNLAKHYDDAGNLPVAIRYYKQAANLGHAFSRVRLQEIQTNNQTTGVKFWPEMTHYQQKAEEKKANQPSTPVSTVSTTVGGTTQNTTTTTADMEGSSSPSYRSS